MAMRSTVPIQMRTLLTGLIGLLCCTTLTGCIAFGYSSGGGWFVWPGGLGLVLLILLILFVLRRR